MDTKRVSEARCRGRRESAMLNGSRPSFFVFAGTSSRKRVNRSRDSSREPDRGSSTFSSSPVTLPARL